MDSGLLEENESLEDSYDVLQALTPAELVGIMDQLICLEVCEILGSICVRAPLILIPGPIDGLAHGQSSVTNSLYITLH